MFNVARQLNKQRLSQHCGDSGRQTDWKIVKLNDTDGHLLCLPPFPKPTAITERIRKQHPRLKFTYHQFILKVDWKKDESLTQGMKLCHNRQN